MKSTTERSFAHLRKQGYFARSVESYNAYTQRRKDVFGFIDIMALHPNEPGVLGVQTTTAKNLQARVKKAESLPAYWKWLESLNDVEFHGWRKLKGVWSPKIIRVSQKDIFQ